MKWLDSFHPNRTLSALSVVVVVLFPCCCDAEILFGLASCNSGNPQTSKGAMRNIWFIVYTEWLFHTREVATQLITSQPYHRIMDWKLGVMTSAEVGLVCPWQDINLLRGVVWDQKGWPARLTMNGLSRSKLVEKDYDPIMICQHQKWLNI